MRINTLTSVRAQAHYTAQRTAASSVISNCAMAHWGSRRDCSDEGAEGTDRCGQDGQEETLGSSQVEPGLEVKGRGQGQEVPLQDLNALPKTQHGRWEGRVRFS